MEICIASASSDNRAVHCFWWFCKLKLLLNKCQVRILHLYVFLFMNCRYMFSLLPFLAKWVTNFQYFALIWLFLFMDCGNVFLQILISRKSVLTDWGHSTTSWTDFDPIPPSSGQAWISYLPPSLSTCTWIKCE